MKIFFTAEYDPAELEPLYAFGEVLMDGWAKGLPNLTEEELLAKTADADMIITTFDEITRAVIENAKNLKLIACTRATPVNIDTAAARERGIPVLFTPGRNSDATAELTIGLMLSIARKIPMAYAALKAGQYTAASAHEKKTKEGLRKDVFWGVGEDSPYAVFKGCELKNKTLSIIGYGSIGRRVGRIARAFGMELLVCDPYVGEIDVEEIGVRKALSLKQAMTEGDFVTCHLKVTPETEGCISREMIACMKPTAYLINASRSAILDEGALVEALREKRIAGAALDVYEKEPIPADHPYLTELDNVVVTPHIAGASIEVLTNHTRMIVGEVRRFLQGEQLLYRYC
ncbi:MAG: dihydrofolate reductase [Ruminococcaceae bacterium]|nr:dihydrofolate reductase [Oscillospiraceae bacterium]